MRRLLSPRPLVATIVLSVPKTSKRHPWVCAPATELLSSTSAPEAIRSSGTDVSSAVTGRRVPSRSVTSLIDVRTSAHMAAGSPNMRHTQSM